MSKKCSSSWDVIVLCSLFRDTHYSGCKTLEIRPVITCAILLIFHQKSSSHWLPLIYFYPLTLSQCWTVVWAAASQVTWENRRPYIPVGHNFALRGLPPLQPLSLFLCSSELSPTANSGILLLVFCSTLSHYHGGCQQICKYLSKNCHTLRLKSYIIWQLRGSELFEWQFCSYLLLSIVLMWLM